MKEVKKLTALVLAAVLVMSLCGAALADGSGAASFTLTPITWDGVGLGKVAVPDGYEMTTEVYCSDEVTSLGAPIQVMVDMVSQKDSTELCFKASEAYMEIVSTNFPSVYKHVDGLMDVTTMNFMYHYMDAAEYCDTLVNNLFSPNPVTFNARNMAAASIACAQSMDALMSSSVDSYLQSSSYSSTDRFTDYIFDRNTYTTSDGYDVSISTSYDYVWEGDNGTVYYSDSAFDMPYGAEQLYPN